MDTYNDISSDANAITLDPQAAGTPRFCELWPSAKQGLELLRGLLKNPIAKAAVGIVISAGDAVAGQVCGK